MKKYRALALILACAAGLSACGKNPPDAGNSDEALAGISENYTISYANWTDSDEICIGALNADKLSVNSVRHLPIYKFDTFDELERFRLRFADLLTLDDGWDEVISFNDATAGYDEAFFAENTLMLIYVGADNCTHRFGVNEIYSDGKAFCVHVAETTGAELVSDAMAGWFLTVEVPDSLIADCTEFDADLDNSAN